MKTVKLSAPIKRDDRTIEQVQLREPKVGQMRGIMLTMVFQMDTTTMLTLIPRLCELTPDELAALPIGDFSRLCVAVIGFFGNADSLGI